MTKTGETCCWKKKQGMVHNYWLTECEEEDWTLDDSDSPADMGFKYCHFCGRSIEVVDDGI